MGGSPRGEPPRLYGVVKHLTMALLAMVIYGALHISLGRIPVANGWDGIDYLVTGSPAQAFDVTNYVFTGLLAFLFSLLMEWYGASSLARWVAILCHARLWCSCPLSSC